MHIFAQRILFVMVFCCAIILPRQALASYSFLSDTIQETYSSGSSIPLNQANMVLQTRDGYIWVASYDGLLRYDGKHSKIFSPEDGFPTKSIMTLFEARDGKLWIGTNNGGLAVYDRHEGFRFFRIQDGLPSNSVRTIAEDGNGTIYAATTLGLAAISPDYEVETVTLPEFGPLVIRDMFVSQKDELWCVLNEGDILIIAKGKLQTHFPNRHFGDAVARTAYQASDGAVYFGFYGSKVAVMGAGYAFKMFDTAPISYINSFYEDPYHRVWVCGGNGIGVFIGGTFQMVEGAGLTDAIENMAVDFEGNLWFASSRKGLLQILKSKFFNISKSAHLPPMGVNATHKFQGKLFIGHDHGLSIIDENGLPIKTPLTERLMGARVRNIVEDKNGNLWFATYSSNGVVKYNKNGNISTFNVLQNNLVSNTVRCALPVSDGSLFVGTAEGISVIRDDKVIRNYTKKDGLINSVIMNFHEDENGTVYAGSDGGGIYAIKDGEITNYTEADGLPSGIIMRTRKDPYGSGLWISTENGICIWNGKEFKTLDKLDSYAVNIFDIQFLEEKSIWLMGLGGIFIVDRKTLFSEEDVVIDRLHERDGLRVPLTANAWNYRTDDNKLYLCTTEGVLSIAMDAVYKNNIPPRLLISSVSIDDKTYLHPESSITILPDTKRITINFSLISYTYPTGNNVTCLLKGFDKVSVTDSTDYTSSVSYTNLPAGKYTFVISGENQEGTKSAELSLPIIKNPHLMENPLIRVGIMACLILFFFISIISYSRYKTRAIRKREQEYRIITEQAIKAIADTIDAKDHYTHGHSKRVAEYSRMIAKRLKLSEKDEEDLYYAALLHDIGKIGLEERILNKTGLLTPEEYDKMKQHVTIGGDILGSITVIQNIATGARYHHERIDGGGYSEGLQGENIPLFARIICVADAYDAMGTTRSYRAGQSREYILEQLKEGRGTQFDAELTDIMIELIEEGVVPVKV